MRTQSKAYLKLGIGAVIILAKLTGPKPIFWSWANAEGVSYNIAGLTFFGIALWLIISGVKDMRKGTAG